MKAIEVKRDNMKLIQREVNRQTFREIKQLFDSAEKFDMTCYFIPTYEFPAAAGIPVIHCVLEGFLLKYFDMGDRTADSKWFKIEPKK